MMFCQTQDDSFLGMISVLNDTFIFSDVEITWLVRFRAEKFKPRLLFSSRQRQLSFDY